MLYRTFVGTKERADAHCQNKGFPDIEAYIPEILIDQKPFHRQANCRAEKALTDFDIDFNIDGWRESVEKIAALFRMDAPGALPQTPGFLGPMMGPQTNRDRKTFFL